MIYLVVFEIKQIKNKNRNKTNKKGLGCENQSNGADQARILFESQELLVDKIPSLIYRIAIIFQIKMFRAQVS